MREDVAMSFYLRHAAGFFLQLFPCMLLCFVPFKAERLRFRQRTIFIGMTAAVLIMSLLFPMTLSVGEAIHNLYMLLAIILLSVAYFYLLREPSTKKLLVICMVMFYATSQYWLVNLALSFVRKGEILSAEVYTNWDLVLYTAATVIMFPLVLLVFDRIVREFICTIETKRMKREFFLVIFSTMIYFFQMIHFDSVHRYTEAGYWRVCGPMFLLALLEQCIIYWLLLRESVWQKREFYHQKALEIQQLQYVNIVREIENVRRIRHDMHHWLNILSNLAEQGKSEEIKDYLIQVTDRVISKEHEMYCRNSALNGLLQYYVGLAGDENIYCEVSADCGDLPVSTIDLTVIFGNVMENAIRSCRGFGQNRQITIKVGVISGSMVMQISNSCREIRRSREYDQKSGFLPAEAFLSTRTGGGYGLGSIEYIARKYGGDARFCFDEEKETFTTRIRLNLYPEMLR